MDERKRYAACGHIEDCGCLQGAECCLGCPLPICVFEPGQVPLNSRQVRMMKRAEQIKEMRQAGVPVLQVARELGVSKRTVSRVLFTPTKT